MTRYGAPMLDAVILDLGNVFAFHDNERLFAEMARAFGRPVDQVHQRLPGDFWERVNTGQLPGDALRREVVERLGRPITPDAWVALWNCHFTLHAELIAAVERLVGRVRLVLLSNTHDQHFAWLRPRLPVLERFDGLVLSCEEGFTKPDPRIYRRALEVAQAPPSRAAFFDDVQRYVDGASALGINARLFTTAARFVADLEALGGPVP